MLLLNNDPLSLRNSSKKPYKYRSRTEPKPESSQKKISQTRKSNRISSTFKSEKRTSRISNFLQLNKKLKEDVPYKFYIQMLENKIFRKKITSIGSQIIQKEVAFFYFENGRGYRCESLLDMITFTMDKDYSIFQKIFDSEEPSIFLTDSVVKNSLVHADLLNIRTNGKNSRDIRYWKTPKTRSCLVPALSEEFSYEERATLLKEVCINSDCLDNPEHLFNGRSFLVILILLVLVFCIIIWKK